MQEYVILKDARWADRRSLLRGHEMRDGEISLYLEPLQKRLAPLGPEVEVAALERRDLQDLTKDPAFVVAAPVMPVVPIEPASEGEDGTPGEAWGVAAVKADVSAFSGKDVVVAVLDSGIDRSHPAFEGMVIVEEDFTETGNEDRRGHGTHCAGTIVGRDVGGVRIGVARGVERLLVGKVLHDGSGNSVMAAKAMLWALQQKAQVISVSLGLDYPGYVRKMVGSGWPVDLATSLALEAYRGNVRLFDTIMRLMRGGMPFGGGAVVIAAVGNESRRKENPQYEMAASLPAAADDVVSVGALAQGDKGLLGVAEFSNAQPRLSAPGVDILSAVPGGGLRTASGSSMAAPHVAGVAALWWEALQNTGRPVSAEIVSAKLLATARTDVFIEGADPADRGFGLVTAP